MIPEYIPEMDLEPSPGFRPHPRPVWPDDGPLPCPRCNRVARLASYVLQTATTRACFHCMLSHGLSSALHKSLSAVFQALHDGWVPSHSKPAADILVSSPDAAHESLLAAIEMRHFMTTKDALDAGNATRAGALRRLSAPAAWLLDPTLPEPARPPEWVVAILQSLASE